MLSRTLVTCSIFIFRLSSQCFWENAQLIISLPIQFVFWIRDTKLNCYCFFSLSAFVFYRFLFNRYFFVDYIFLNLSKYFFVMISEKKFNFFYFNSLLTHSIKVYSIKNTVEVINSIRSCKKMRCVVYRVPGLTRKSRIHRT